MTIQAGLSFFMRKKEDNYEKKLENMAESSRSEGNQDDSAVCSRHDRNGGSNLGGRLEDGSISSNAGRSAFHIDISRRVAGSNHRNNRGGVGNAKSIFITI